PQPITAGTSQTVRATAGRFTLTPGVYVLSAGAVDVASLPATIGHIGFREYHAPPVDSVSLAVVALAAPQYLVGRDAEVRARIVDALPPDSVPLCLRSTPVGVSRWLRL